VQPLLHSIPGRWGNLFGTPVRTPLELIFESSRGHGNTKKRGYRECKGKVLH
jgi:hypothetical protein